MTKSKTQKSLGICIGAANIKFALLSWEDEKPVLAMSKVVAHECNPKAIFLKEIAEFADQYDFLCITGRKFKDSLNLPIITEPEASEYALKYFLAGRNDFACDALISLGSENFILYELDAVGHIINVHAGNKCASGTGEFFLQQIRRMNVDVHSAIELAHNSTPYRVSGRCSVFCKSDCTHALNKGVSIGNVCAGLGDMISVKVQELLRCDDYRGILLAGGVTKNSYVVKKLCENISKLVIVDHADIFEALGAAIYAFEKKTLTAPITFKKEHSSFTYHSSLQDAQHLVSFKEHTFAVVKPLDECILGLDVGSTTTKAVLLRVYDDKILGSSYLRTNGNPIKAARECYTELEQKLQDIEINIIGLGVTGSGRYIAGLHALTSGIINEIIAHATAATFFDPEVDTILEIGGQDAKYTFLVNGVPCDYAMNEACSAGTGSFLEEAAKESLNINYLDIQDIALKAQHPPNFNDQCAAFISSDIKNASYENLSREDIISGLVYSICMNYNNRVKGSRKIGNKIFMQGGVCYNKAVPIAMAALLQKKIIVPPEPGLMGAFGVALEIKSRLALGLLEKSTFSLRELITREVEYGKSFNCAGHQENCDRKCTINLIKLNGKNYPFGGICNKYYNQVHHVSVDPKQFDLVTQRQKLVFQENDFQGKRKERNTIGLVKSYLVNTLYPLYYHFFNELGFKVILSDELDRSGLKRVFSSFCFPAEISHGMFMNLLNKNLDYIFLPHITELHVTNSLSYELEMQSVCGIVQTEPYYLRSAFRRIKPKLISPVLNFSQGWHTAEKDFIKIGKELGVAAKAAKKAFQNALTRQLDFFQARKTMGDLVLAELTKDRTKVGIVLFGRAYNAFAKETNLGIPRKFASRGIYIIPYDCLRYENEDSIEHMGWATGQEILKGTHYVKKHPQLFAVYITNFSCGPDSFLIGYFRDIMQNKPSLTLELDSHSTDTGINTRIEAFLDIVQRFKKLNIQDQVQPQFVPARLEAQPDQVRYISSENESVSLHDSRVKIVFPSMGRITTEIGAATFRGIGFNAIAVPNPSFKTLLAGRGNTSCKECLPLILTVGSLLEYLKQRKDEKELTLYFMPTTSGGCRFSQYYVFLKKLVAKKQLKNVAFLSLDSSDGYSGIIGAFDISKIIYGLIIGDIMDDIKNVILALAKDKEQALQIFNAELQRIINCASNAFNPLLSTLEKVAQALSAIELKYPLSQAKKVLLAGEIYVRRDNFATQEILDRLTKKEIVVSRSPVLEWLYYVDYMVRINATKPKDFLKKTKLFLRNFVQKQIENKIKRIFAKTGLYHYESININEIVTLGGKFINVAFGGEAILTVGSFFQSLLHQVHGFISIGPFACLPTRIVESILTPESKLKGNERLNFLKNPDFLKQVPALPFISIECDGNPFPPIIEARIEAFCLQVERRQMGDSLTKS